MAAISLLALIMAVAGAPPGDAAALGPGDHVRQLQSGGLPRSYRVHTPGVEVLTPPGDDLPVTRRIYSGGRDGAEVVLVEIQGGGHTWPGQVPLVGFLGRTTTNVHANTLIWEFFQKHPRPGQTSASRIPPKVALPPGAPD